MQLGYGLITCQRYPGDPRTWANLYREAVDLAKLCEEAGLDSVWTSEHHFVDDGYMPSLAVASAAIAAATGRIEIGTGVVLGPLHHPLRLAEDAATVDCIAGGRFILGLGAGWRAEEFDRLGVPRHGVGRRLSETVRILRRAWGSDPFSFEGKVFSFGTTNVTPKPARSIPLFIGGSAAAALRRVGRMGDGYLGSGVSLEDVPQHMHLIRAGLDARGRDPASFRYWVHEPVWVTEDPDRDLEEAIRRYAYIRWKYADMANAQGRPSDPLPEPPPLDEATRAGVARQLIYGTPEQVAEKVSAFGAALGEGAQLVARSHYPGLSFERSAAMIRLLGEVKRLVHSPAGAGKTSRV